MNKNKKVKKSKIGESMKREEKQKKNNSLIWKRGKSGKKRENSGTGKTMQSEGLIRSIKVRKIRRNQKKAEEEREAGKASWNNINIELIQI